MVLLGVRPAGTTPGFHVLGRQTFLAPVEWVDGWPVVGALDLEVPTRPPGAGKPVAAEWRDDFSTPELGPRWLALRRPPSSFISKDTAGHLVIDGIGASLDDPEASYVGIRQQHLRFQARTEVAANTDGEAGLAVIMDETAHYEIVATDETVVVRLRLGAIRSVIAEVPRPDGPIVLRVETDRHDAGPDTVRFGFEASDGTFRVVGELDGRYLSTEVQGGFIGRTIGLFASRCRATFNWFEYRPLDDS